jgi:hypothetical protein
VKIERGFAIWCGVLLVSLLLVTNYIGARERQRGSQSYACAESRPQGMCNAANTCGSSSEPCRIDIRRKGSNWASATPNIPGAKANAIFCVKVGTTVMWESSSKNTGFVIDFGPTSPFDTPGAIMGGPTVPFRSWRKGRAASNIPRERAPPGRFMECADLRMPRWL